MKTIYKLLSLYEDDIGHSLFGLLADAYPEGVKQLPRTRGFDFSLEDRDPRAQEALALLRAHGYTPNRDFTTPEAGKTFNIQVERLYDEADLLGCDYCDLHGFNGQFVADTPKGRDADGALVLNAARLKPDADFGITTGDLFLVSDRLKEEMEAQRFAHVVLRPTKLSGNPLARAKINRPFWEWTTDLLSPPLSPSLLRVQASGRVVEDLEAAVVVYREGLEFPEVFYPYELRYTGVSLASLEPFDLAVLREQVRNRPPGMTWPRPRLASRRFYEFCRDRRLPFSWRPVRVEGAADANG